MAAPVRYELHTADGQVWALSQSDGPVKLHTDPEGVEGAAFGFDDQQNVDQPGVTMRARMFDPNYVLLDVRVGPVTPGPAAAALLAQWRRSLGNGAQLHTLHAISTWGGDRFQVVRLAEKLPPPPLARMAASGVITHDQARLRSDESWWRKDPVVVEFTADQFAGATVVSESEAEVWPHFVLTGPITTPTLGVEGEAVPLPSLAAGEVWTIDTDPDWFTITDQTGADRSWVGRRWYKRAAAAPLGGTRPVPVTITGTGTTVDTRLQVTLPQLFYGGV